MRVQGAALAAFARSVAEASTSSAGHLENHTGSKKKLRRASFISRNPL